MSHERWSSCECIVQWAWSTILHLLGRYKPLDARAPTVKFENFFMNNRSRVQCMWLLVDGYCSFFELPALPLFLPLSFNFCSYVYSICRCLLALLHVSRCMYDCNYIYLSACRSVWMSLYLSFYIYSDLCVRLSMPSVVFSLSAVPMTLAKCVVELLC